jgi:hypothetical protein
MGKKIKENVGIIIQPWCPTAPLKLMLLATGRSGFAIIIDPPWASQLKPKAEMSSCFPSTIQSIVQSTVQSRASRLCSDHSAERDRTWSSGQGKIYDTCSQAVMAIDTG